MLCLFGTNLAIGTDLGLILALLLGSNWPVNEEEIHIGELQQLQRVLQRPPNILGTVEVIPDLGGDKQVLALHRRSLFEEVGNGISNLILVEVEPGAVQVSVSGAQGMESGSVSLSRLTLAGEGTEPDGGDNDTVVERVCLSVGHCETSKGRGRGRGRVLIDERS